MKLRERAEKYLHLKGFRIVKSRSKKYIKMQKGNRIYWIGKNGGVRAGRTIAESISVTDIILNGARREGIK